MVDRALVFPRLPFHLREEGPFGGRVGDLHWLGVSEGKRRRGRLSENEKEKIRFEIPVSWSDSNDLIISGILEPLPACPCLNFTTIWRRRQKALVE